VIERRDRPLPSWLTGVVHASAPAPLTTRTVETIPDTDHVLETAEPASAHIVKTEPGESAAAKVLEARIYGTALEALCGHVWVPSRDPKQLPLCEQCKSIYDMYKAFNDGLNDQPNE
jgi:hypothetical protein